MKNYCLKEWFLHNPFCGVKNGLFRKTGISNLNKEQRVKELKVRKVMLKSHQIIGYLTLAGMIAQGILGGKLYNNWERDLYNTQNCR